jgi:hypothetical protein
MSRYWKLAILVGAAMALAHLAHGQPVERHMFAGPPGGGCGDQLVQAVGLTETQKTALQGARQQAHTSLQAVGEQARSLHQQIEASFSGGATPDRCALGDLLIQGHGYLAQMQTIIHNAESGFVSSLSPDQQSRYAAFVAAHPGCTFIAGGHHPGMMM